MSSDPALAVLAARIRFALQRHNHQPVDTASMLADTAYAASIVAQCRAANVPSLTALADQFEALLRAGRDKLAASGGVPTSRFARSDAPASTPAADPGPATAAPVTTRAPVSRPPAAPSTQSAPATTQQPSAHTGSESPHDDPHDPNHPRNRRYLRGAR